MSCCKEAEELLGGSGGDGDSSVDLAASVQRAAGSDRRRTKSLYMLEEVSYSR